MSGERPIRVAGTAVVLRDGAEGIETLLLRRPGTGSFAGAWVFPGGGVESGDRRGAEASGGERADAEAEAARAAAVRETREEAGIGLGELALLSCWIPPEQAPARFRTWFFLARDIGDAVHINPGEIEEAVWRNPEQALAQHAAGILTLFPPTWVTLHGLLGHRTVDDVFSAIGEPVRFVTHLRADDDGDVVMWAGDEEHPSLPGSPGARHRLRMGSPPWTYENI